jgi:N6-L-threonylcarbamoyladenine synthase
MESRMARGGVKILGIESSCDETAAAVVVDGRTILSNVVASQIDIHRKYGGVVPELASREHLRQIVPVVREAMAVAGLKFEEWVRCWWGLPTGRRWRRRWANR